VLQFSISHDNARIALARVSPGRGTSEIWIVDRSTGTERQLTLDPSWETRPFWSPDDSRLVFSSDREGPWRLYERATNGVGPEHQLPFNNGSTQPFDWLQDGRLFFRQWARDDEARGDSWMASSTEDQQPVRVSAIPWDANDGRLSPDGSWLAYEKWESTSSIYLRSLGTPETRWHVTPEGGAEPRWRADGSELFYLGPDLSMMVISIDRGVVPGQTTARRLFQTHAVVPSGVIGQAYDVTSDGQQFLIKVAGTPTPIDVLVNWTTLLEHGG
jgi:Tol biopolymer transport system component